MTTVTGALQQCGRCGHSKVDHVRFLLRCDRLGCGCEEFADPDYEAMYDELLGRHEQLQRQHAALTDSARGQQTQIRAMRARIDELEHRLKAGAARGLDRPSTGGFTGND